MAEKRLSIDYSSLAPTTEIRILTLERGRGDDPIVCTLRPVTRDGAEYHALSYEWEDESKNDPSITIDGRHVQIRMNLYDALKNIRKPTEDQRLWVDAMHQPVRCPREEPASRHDGRDIYKRGRCHIMARPCPRR